MFTGAEVRAGQQVFLKYGLMDNGTIWGHGALLGPDYSAESLHTLAVHLAANLAQQRHGQLPQQLSLEQRAAIEAEVRTELKRNRYDPRTLVLQVSSAYGDWFRHQPSVWAAYFTEPARSGGLSARTISDPDELRQLSAFVAWTAWASVTNRPNETHTYTNNFPYDPLAGNLPSGSALLWSALSLIFLLGGTALVLLAFGKFDYLGWKAKPGHLHTEARGRSVSLSQRATLKYFAVVALLLVAQTLVGGAGCPLPRRPGQFLWFRSCGVAAE
ncbi:MAG: hypothetical protein NUV51_08450 [Sulfuricaulis sp.]|nr:hypothetical protein [Sulfuricaulis sp.]